MPQINVIPLPPQKRNVASVANGKVFRISDRWYISCSTDPHYESSPKYNAFDLTKNIPTLLDFKLIVAEIIEEPVIISRESLEK